MPLQTLVLATLCLVPGVETRWVDVAGQQTYEIKIEESLPGRMESQQEAVVADASDEPQQIRRFQICTNSERTGRTRLATENHGWLVAEHGRFDYWVQLSPDQFNQLRAGTTLISEIVPRSGKVNKIFVFVGTARLPRDAKLDDRKVDHLRQAASHLEAAGLHAEARRFHGMAVVASLQSDLERAVAAAGELKSLLRDSTANTSLPELDSPREALNTLLMELQKATTQLRPGAEKLDFSSPLPLEAPPREANRSSIGDSAARSDLAVTINQEPNKSNSNVGEETTFGINIQNGGMTTLRDVVVTVTVPPSLEPLFASPGCVKEANGLSWAIAKVPARESVAKEVVTKARNPGPATISVSVRAGDTSVEKTKHVIVGSD